MEVRLVTLMGEDVPEHMRDKGLLSAYQVTSYDGSITTFETGADAARFASKLHREHRDMLGLDDDRDY